MPSVSQNNITEFQDKLLGWFRTNGRMFPWRDLGKTNYQLVIAEVLLQRTKAETVNKFYDSFIQRFPSWDSLNEATLETLEEILKPVGLFRQRAKRLKNLALEMANRHGVFPDDRKELEAIPFMGQYIANAVQLLIFKKPLPLIDVNMARVLERYFGERQLADIRYDPYLQQLAAQVVDHEQSKEINWAILDFAAIICKARRPLCEVCFLSDTCLFAKKTLNGLFLP